MGWYHPSKFPNSSSRIHFNWFDRVCFKSLLFKFLFFNTSLNCRFILLLVIFSGIMQWGFCKYVLSCAVTPNPFQTWPFSTKWQNSIIFFCHSQISLMCLICLSIFKGNDVIYFIFFRINIAVVLAPVLTVEATIRIITSTYLIVVGQIKNVLLAGFFYVICWFLFCWRNFIS